MNLDNQITSAINSLAGRLQALDYSAIFFAKYAVFIIILSIAITWFFRTDQSVWRFRAISSGMAVAIGLLLNQAILQFVSRIRPYDLGITHLIVAKSADPSFPSDHATLAFAIAFTLFLLRDRLGFGYLFIAILVGLARVFVGIHFVGDVVGGAMTALLAAALVHITYKSSSKLNTFLIRIF